MAKSEPLSEGFPPLLNDDVTFVILGSLPGVRSLEQQQYFAHPRNVFWRLMGDITGIDWQRPYAERCNQLLAVGVGLWDVLAASERHGSLDSAIIGSTAVANDIGSLTRTNAKLRGIGFNGKKSRDLFDRLVLPTMTHLPELLTLPSTSPAHAAMSYDEKLQHWSCIGKFLD